MIRQEQTHNFITFAKTIEDYLLSIKSKEETLVRSSNINFIDTNCILYTRSGIKVLNIQPDTFIGVYYANNPSSFVDIDLNDYFIGERIVVFVNVEKRFSLNIKTNFRIIFLDDLDSKLHIKDSHNYVEGDNPKGACIPIERFDEFVRFSIRANILLKLFSGISYKIYDVKDESGVSPFPFLYDDEDKKYIFFVNKKDIQKANISDFDDSVIYAQVNIKNKELESKSLMMTITYKEKIDFNKTNYGQDSKHIEVNKLDVGEINKFAILFNRSSRYYIDEFIPLYKYRQFEKTRYSPSEEVVKYVSTSKKYNESYEICIGSRNAIENDSIWFSNYSALNDPFDLTIRYPSKLTKRISSTMDRFYEGTKYYDIHKSGILVFCTTSSDNNILMWSHYGDSHKGMCTGYLENEILSTIASDKSVGICFYGKVDYPPIRPVFRMYLKELLFISADFAYFRFNIQNLFSKYKDWSYEKEYRFIIVPNENSLGDYVSYGGHEIKLAPFNYIFGYNFPPNFTNYLSTAGISFKKFDLSDSKYKLIK